MGRVREEKRREAKRREEKRRRKKITEIQKRNSEEKFRREIQMRNSEEKFRTEIQMRNSEEKFRREIQKKDFPGARKGRKVAIHYIFQMICGSAGCQKLRCRKSARRCGTKHISKSKCTKHFSFGPLLEVEMSKKCTPLWREARFQVKTYKAHQLRTTFGSSDVEKVHAVVARSTFPSQKWKKLRGSEHFWTFRCRFRVAGARDCAP